MKINGGVPQGEQSIRPSEDQRWSPPRITIYPFIYLIYLFNHKIVSRDSK